MEYSKEEYERLINGSPLFELDPESDCTLYKSEKRRLISLVVDYYRFCVYIGKPLEEYDLTLLETLNELIKYYDKGKGLFVHLLNHTMKRNLGIAKAKEAADRHRQGLTIGVKNERAIRAILAYAKSKNLDPCDLATQEQIARALNISLKQVCELIAMNENAVASSAEIENEDGDSVSILEMQADKGSTPEEVVTEEASILELLEKINNAFASLQNRPQTKRLLAMLLTAEILKALNEDVDTTVRMLKGRTFFSEEIMIIYKRDAIIPTARKIAELCDVMEQSVSRTYNGFLKRLRTIDV